MRRGMTLIELLLVLVIVVGLLAIGVPGLVIVNNGQRVNNAANSLAAALSQARARAMFDKRPHGIRLTRTNPDTPNAAWFDTIEFITLPPPISEGYVTGNAGSIQLTATFTFPQNAFTNDNVYLVLNGQGQAFKVRSVDGRTISLWRPLEFDVTAPSSGPPNYTIFDITPQPVSALRPVQLSPPVVVVFDTGTPASNKYSKPDSLATNPEIVFAPDGSLLRPDSAARSGSPAGSVVFWVARYEEQGTAGYIPQDKGAILVAVNPYNGRITSYPVNNDPSIGNGDPYHYLKAGAGLAAQ